MTVYRQLAVIHGLVTARIQASRGGPDIYSLRCSPVSYGILCREPYDPIKHQGEPIAQDPYDKKRWAERQIDWIVKQGQLVPADYGATYMYRFKIPLGKEQDPWSTHIVISSLPPHQLPSSMKREGARHLCKIVTVLSPTDMKRKNRHWYDLRKEYNRAEFEIRLIAGTGLRFEIWSQNGNLRSHDHGESRFANSLSIEGC